MPSFRTAYRTPAEPRWVGDPIAEAMNEELSSLDGRMHVLPRLQMAAQNSSPAKGEMSHDTLRISCSSFLRKGEMFREGDCYSKKEKSNGKATHHQTTRPAKYVCHVRQSTLGCVSVATRHLPQEERFLRLFTMMTSACAA